MKSFYQKIIFSGFTFLLLTISSLLFAGDEKTFPNPKAALQALSSAVNSADINSALTQIFGKDSSDLWNTGDPTQDQKITSRFLQRLNENKKWVAMDATHQILYLGKDSWPFPIPLVKKGNQWIFDTAIGRQEILNRRIGGNELDAIQSAQDYVRAQKEYAALPTSHGKFAEKFISDEGKKNGLYWMSNNNPHDQSPIGPKITQALAEGYKLDPSQQTLLYHGYYYKMLGKAGKNMPGLLAYPAKWNDSGVMTFIVSPEGQVFQKNLGKDTLQIISKMNTYKQDSDWKKVE